MFDPRRVNGNLANQDVTYGQNSDHLSRECSLCVWKVHQTLFSYCIQICMHARG